MDYLKTSLVAVIAALIVLVGVHLSPQQAPKVQNNVGALAGPDIPSPYLNWGGVRIFNYGSALKQNASTTCSFAITATSTLESAAIKFDTSSSTALILDIAKDSNPFSTTTKIGTTYALGTGQSFVQASTTPAAGAKTVFAPGTYLNFKLGGKSVKTDVTKLVPVGRCQAMFIQYPTL